MRRHLNRFFARRSHHRRFLSFGRAFCPTQAPMKPGGEE